MRAMVRKARRPGGRRTRPASRSIDRTATLRPGVAWRRHRASGFGGTESPSRPQVWAL